VDERRGLSRPGLFWWTSGPQFTQHLLSLSTDNGQVSPPAPEFEFGTDGPSLILVGVDGSRTSLRAAAYAGGLARRQGCRLLAVYVGRIPASAGAAPHTSATASTPSAMVSGNLKLP